jgi:peptidoglycan/LPS O-acetylase OafA/YrhL
MLIDRIQRVVVLDALRGVASFGVCWYHFTHGNPTFLRPGPLKFSGEFGWLGIEVFFVISGFVIPFALSRNDYDIRGSGRFLVKRVVRLDPPYFTTIILILGLGYLSSKTPGFQGNSFMLSWPQLLLHVGYLNAFFGYPWLNPVFWTLAIELQYYLLVAFIFPLLLTRRPVIRIGTLASLAALSFAVPAPQFVFHWLLLFLLGIATFQFRDGALGKGMYLTHITAITSAAFFSLGAVITLAALITALAIAFVNMRRSGVLGWLGKISYSLYLLHAPIGGRFINLSTRFGDALWVKCAALIAASLASILAAWLLYRLVELPAQRWSAAIGYRKKEIAPSGFAPRLEQ